MKDQDHTVHTLTVQQLFIPLVNTSDKPDGCGPALQPVHILRNCFQQFQKAKFQGNQMSGMLQRKRSVLKEVAY